MSVLVSVFVTDPIPKHDSFFNIAIKNKKIVILCLNLDPEFRCHEYVRLEYEYVETFFFFFLEFPSG